MADNLSPEVRRDLHSDAVVLNRQQLWLVPLALALVALALWITFGIGVGSSRGRTVGASALMLGWAVRTCLEWRRLRRVNPDEYE